MSILGAIIVWTLFGLVAGAIARLLVPGPQNLGMMGTIALGIVGSFAGGMITYLVRGGELVQPSGFVMSIVGAVVLLIIGMSAGRRIRV